jgi:hypothetical protein
MTLAFSGGRVGALAETVLTVIVTRETSSSAIFG